MTTPLSHHEILALVAPFSRRGRAVDLAASDRLERRLVFKPVMHGGDGGGGDLPALQDTLLLEPFGAGTWRLTRTLRHGSGLVASLRTVGPDPGALLAAIEAVPPHTQFRFGADHGVAYSQRLADGAAGPRTDKVVLEGVAQVGAVRLAMTVPSTRGVAAELRLTAPGGPSLPQDLLAVQGWNWARMIRDTAGWRSRLRLRGPEPGRSRQAEAGLEQAALHLARTLAEPPVRFHERFLAARWGVVLRRSIPVLTLVLLGLGLWVLARYAVGKETGAWVLLIHVPTLMLAISFRMQELAQFEFPPLPRRPDAQAWGACAIGGPAAAAAAGGAARFPSAPGGIAPADDGPQPATAPP